MSLIREVERYYDALPAGDPRALQVFNEFKFFLNRGEIRAAELIGERWIAHAWVKKGILLGFRLGVLSAMPSAGPFRFFDNHTFPVKDLSIEQSVRIVPGGSAVRDGAYLGPGVICMPPSYVNVGARVEADTLIDSHVLVGSCAQIGRNVHLGAGTVIGGVLEPVGTLPVIVEDDVTVGGNSGIFEGTIIHRGAVLGAGVILTGSMPVYDCVRERVLRRAHGGSLEIPPGAVVVPGTRPVESAWARAEGLGVATPLIIKYRDDSTESASWREDALR
jgi:2,3,4,5-tetrahydropyridine-2-carboxylate N-succinyltransferase